MTHTTTESIAAQVRAGQVREQARWNATKRTVSRSKRLLGYLESSLLRTISDLATDVRFQLWKRRHPGATFADYYARSIAAKLKRGHAHKTLGMKRPARRSPAVMEGRATRPCGNQYFDLAIRHGLLPEHTCIDYGCGSLRVGKHLIEYLAIGNYWGLDIIDDFFEVGKMMLPPGLLEEKRPQLHTISDASRDAAMRAAPDFVFSFAVLQHVPPSELDAYLRNILSFLAPHTTAVITFNEVDRCVRTGTKIWGYSKDEILAALSRQPAELDCTIYPRRDEDALPRRSVLLIRQRAGC